MKKTKKSKTKAKPKLKAKPRAKAKKSVKAADEKPAQKLYNGPGIKGSQFQRFADMLNQKRAGGLLDPRRQ